MTKESEWNVCFFIPSVSSSVLLYKHRGSMAFIIFVDLICVSVLCLLFFLLVKWNSTLSRFTLIGQWNLKLTSANSTCLSILCIWCYCYNKSAKITTNMEGGLVTEGIKRRYTSPLLTLYHTSHHNHDFPRISSRSGCWPKIRSFQHGSIRHDAV